MRLVSYKKTLEGIAILGLLFFTPKFVLGQTTTSTYPTSTPAIEFYAMTFLDILLIIAIAYIVYRFLI